MVYHHQDHSCEISVSRQALPSWGLVDYSAKMDILNRPFDSWGMLGTVFMISSVARHRFDKYGQIFRNAAAFESLLYRPG